MVATFIGMLIPLIKGKPTIIAVTAAGLMSIIARPLPHQLGLIIATIVGIFSGVIFEYMLKNREEISNGY